MTAKEQRRRKVSTYNVDVTSCTRDREVFTIVREAQVGDGLPVSHKGLNKSVGPIRSNHPHALANGDRPSSDPLASVEQIHYRVVPARGEVATTGIESGSDAASNVGGEVFAQTEGGDVDDADSMLRHVGEDHTVTRMVEHRG